MEPIFTQDTTVADLIAGANTGHVRITFKVHGYWSADSISVYAVRRMYGEPEKTWAISISHASGGRDTKEVESDIQAAENFGKTMIEAARVARALELHIPELEAAYERGMVQLREHEAKRMAEIQAKIDADAPVGIERAEQITARLVAEAKETGKPCSIHLVQRGDIDTYTQMFKVMYGGRSVFRINGNPVKRAEFVEFMSKMSARNM